MHFQFSLKTWFAAVFLFTVMFSWYHLLHRFDATERQLHRTVSALDATLYEMMDVMTHHHAIAIRPSWSKEVIFEQQMNGESAAQFGRRIAALIVARGDDLAADRPLPSPGTE